MTSMLGKMIMHGINLDADISGKNGVHFHGQSWAIFYNWETKPHVTLTQFAKTYGRLFKIRLGTQLVVVGSSKEAAIEILKTHDRVLSGRSIPHAALAKSKELSDLQVGWTVECNDQWNIYVQHTKRSFSQAEHWSLRQLLRENGQGRGEAYQ
ncbi:hypothetical protein GH714_002148 [Hevea brasiliensis]|uniref:Cytochrome P450 n=1 Tax=Hevea brasiliensis TaxID=3981 RepID=A0A6A6L8D1_HEVBR|nr:hypothetical protein GH714_002148 [Hevea brasiliensis]